MESIVNTKMPIIRTERGLTVAGTRATLYTIMDYVKADWPPLLIRQWLDLTERQLQAALDYIHQYRDAVEAEYQQVLRQAEETRQYWEQRNHERLAEVAGKPTPPEQQQIRAKLRARKTELGMA